MLPPVTSKQLLCLRAVSSMVFDKIASEVVDTNIVALSQVSSISTEESIYVAVFIYWIYVYSQTKVGVSKQQSDEKSEKLKRLSKYVLSDNVYEFVKVFILALFLLIKDPKVAV
jgi:hypothetical protein